MGRLRTLVSRLHTWLRPGSAAREFDDELAGHLEMLREDYERRGLTPDEAARAARLRLGPAAGLREIHRDQVGLPGLEAFIRDVAYGVRTLARSPGFTSVAILTLALGIGANTAIFSVVDAVLLKPLPYERPSELVTVFQAKPADGIEMTGWSYANYADLNQEEGPFVALAGSQHHQLTLTGQGDPVAVNTSVVTVGFFSVFGRSPKLGRALRPADHSPGAPPVVVLSEGLWRGTFGGDPDIVGKVIDLDSRGFTVVGVMPETFRFPLVSETSQVWIPLAQDPLFGPWMPRRGGHWLQVTGRLKPGIAPAEAEAALEHAGARLAAAYPADNQGWVPRMVPLRQTLVGDVGTALVVMLGAVALVLLIACANIANLLLARATTRAREMAIRTALGAGRGRLVRQLLAETALLGLAAGAIGVGLAVAGVQGLGALLPADIPRINALRVDLPVLAFALALSGLTTLLFGLMPAMFAASPDLAATLRDGARSGEAGARRRARQILVAVEIAVALVLLVGAGLVVRSLARLTAVDPGFTAAKVVTAEVSLPRFQYARPDQWLAFADGLLERLQAEPGLAETAIAVPAPIADGQVNLGFDVVGRSASSGLSMTADYVAASPGYFRVMGVPLVRGRLFDAHDRADAPRVCLISEAMARTYFPGEDPIGRRLRFAFPPDSSSERDIVGIVGDVRDIGLDREPGPMMYVPYAQAPFPGAVLLVRTDLTVAAVVATIRRDVGRLDARLPVTDVASLPDLVADSVAQPRFRAVLLGLFAALAVVLAATGVFGLISYSVSCRTQEIGIRLALGATRGAVLRLVFRETFLLAAVGLAVGVPVALGLSRLLGHLLFDISSHDPTTLALAVAMVALAAGLAGYLPARRATRVAPMAVLRHD